VITGIVIGEITATIRHPFFEGKKMLVVARTGADGTETGDYVIALDAIGVGPGDPVLVLDEGNGARQVVGSTTAPVRSVVVGFLDRVDLA
jgi:ethanolamine utilization protein EutN